MLLEDIPVAYESLKYLHTKLGDVEIVKCVCVIWNKLHIGDSVRYKEDDGISVITVTGKCQNVEEMLNICKLHTTVCIQIRHEPTTITIEL